MLKRLNFFNILLMHEGFLSRLVRSSCAETFILKGG
jgi:hypothetical protein